jgi:hypothetical protein
MIRVYVVTEKQNPANRCLVRAASKQRAIRLAAQQFTTCELASTDTVLQLAKAGALIIEGDAETPDMFDEVPPPAPTAPVETRPAEEVFRDE